MNNPTANLRDIELRVNGRVHQLTVAHHRTLLEVLRDSLDLTGAKSGCDRGECGACTVIVGGQAVYACQMLALQVGNRPVVTVEGLANADGYHPLQDAFLARDGGQCGFCTPGFLMAAKALLDRNLEPDRDEVRRALAGNICRCNAYGAITQSVLAAARAMVARGQTQ